MARPLRLEFPGALFHVTSRGDRREDIYHNDLDRTEWLNIFGNVCERFNWICHAYCQMTNHYHFVVETPDANLSKGMRQLNGVYTQFVNRSYKRVGHVFQGRFKGILVERESYLLELSRYVVLNPVRAGMVKDPCDWPWSSHLAIMGDAPQPDWLETDWLLSHFGKRRSSAQGKYEQFVRSGVGRGDIWDNLRNQVFLGGDSFVTQMQNKIPQGETLHEIPRKQRRMPAKPLSWYARKGREGMAMAYRTGDYTMQEIASEFGVHYSTVSRVVEQFEFKMRVCKT